MKTYIYIYMYITYHVSRITYHVSRITYHVSRIMYHISYIIYHISYIIYHISYIGSRGEPGPCVLALYVNTRNEITRLDVFIAADRDKRMQVCVQCISKVMAKDGSCK